MLRIKNVKFSKVNVMDENSKENANIDFYSTENSLCGSITVSKDEYIENISDTENFIFNKIKGDSKMEKGILVKDKMGKVLCELIGNQIKTLNVEELNQNKTLPKLVFENVKLGDWGHGERKLELSDDIQKLLEDKNIKIKLERSNHAGLSNYKTFGLEVSMNSNHTLVVHRNDFGWGDSLEFESKGLESIQVIDEKQYVVLDKVTIIIIN